MSKLHYFQRYSQRENVVTNNTLLLLSRLYAHSPQYFDAFLSDLLEVESLQIGVSFTQQTPRRGVSVPDGLMDQRSVKVVVETKLHPDAELGQLRKHLESFEGEDSQVLLLLTPAEPGADFQRGLDDAVREYNERNGVNVVAVCTTFTEIIRSYEGALAAHDYELHDLLDDFEDFCTEFPKADLLPRRGYRMRAVPCGETLDENFRFEIYYRKADEAYQGHKYIGVYKDKQIQGIGEIENEVVAKLTDEGFQVIEQDEPVSQAQRDRIEGAIRSAADQRGVDLTIGFRFFLVEKFHKTSFRKQTPGGLRGPQYLDLGHKLNETQLPPVEEIAERLFEKTW